MGSRKKRELPPRLARAVVRFAKWRGARAAGTRIPQSLWALAVELASTYGVCQTAGALRLDYYHLKKRVAAQSSRSGPALPPPPLFVELPASTMSPPGECVIEWENSTGSRMRVHLKGGQTPDLVALSGSFWSGQQ